MLQTACLRGVIEESSRSRAELTDVAMTDEGMVVMIRKSKTGQTGASRKIGNPFAEYVETCPVRAVLVWVEEAEIEGGPLFRARFVRDKNVPQRPMTAEHLTLEDRMTTFARTFPSLAGIPNVKLWDANSLDRWGRTHRRLAASSSPPSSSWPFGIHTIRGFAAGST